MSAFEDYPQDVLGEAGKLAKWLTCLYARYGVVIQTSDPKTAYLDLAREWDGLDLIAVQQKFSDATEAVQLLLAAGPALHKDREARKAETGDECLHSSVAEVIQPKENT